MEDFFKEFNGDFIYINCDIFPIMSFMHRDRTIIKQESVYNLYEYVSNILNLIDAKKTNLKLLELYESDVIEIIMNENGIVKISLKEKYYDR